MSDPPLAAVSHVFILESENWQCFSRLLSRHFSTILWSRVVKCFERGTIAPMYHDQDTIDYIQGHDGCVPLKWSGSGSVIRDYSDHGRSNEPMNPCPEWIHQFIWAVFLSVNPKWNLDLKTDFAFLSANLNPDFWSDESFLKKDSLDLKSEESESRLTD